MAFAGNAHGHNNGTESLTFTENPDMKPTKQKN